MEKIMTRGGSCMKRSPYPETEGMVVKYRSPRGRAPRPRRVDLYYEADIIMYVSFSCLLGYDD